MKRIAKIVKKENFIPEQGYMIFTEKGLMVYNGRFGILYSPKKAGERMMGLVAQHGRFAIPGAVDFLKTLSLLEDVSSVELNKAASCLNIKFNKGKGSKDIPIVLGLGDRTPHFEIKWRDYAADKATGTPITGIWRETADLITNEGEALWGDVIGVYLKKKHLLSFDYGVYLAGPQIETGMDEFFCPSKLLELGINDIEYAAAGDGAVFLVGPDVQYVCTAVQFSNVVDDMAKLKDSFQAGQQHPATVVKDGSVWKRAKAFGGDIVKLVVKGGDMVLMYENGKEQIGQTGAPDAEFTTRVSLLERWAQNLDNKVAVSADGSWYLNATTRSGLGFYAVLTDIRNPMKAKATEGKVETAKSEEADITVTDTLL